MRRAAPLLMCLGALAACAPVPVSRAERVCRDQLQPQTRGEARVGIVSDGTTVRMTRRVDIDLTLETAGGRDPEQTWRSCVHRLSGQLPTRPFRAN
jgi:hypothetical protein